ncbi:MAG TPA: hypothetical protein VMO47_08630 [Rhodothermales bacterium]|nr:hypothetical protein [Rhodothermales bacterium]
MKKFALIGMVLLCGWSPDPAIETDEMDEASCVSTDPPVYYAIDLVSTRKLPGTRLASGTVDMTFQASPFGIAVGSGGHYRYNLNGRIEKMKPPREGVYVVWLSTPDLDQVHLVGPLGATMTFEGAVDWQKFLVIVTLEKSFDPAQTRWQGPVALRGLSRSGMMHTMAGHGPFQSEPCAFFGYK